MPATAPSRVIQQGRGRSAMWCHRARPLTPLGARQGAVPSGWGGGRRLAVSGALSVATTTAFGAFRAMLARRSQRGRG